MKKLENYQMENVSGGGRTSCFAAMASYGASMGLLSTAKTDAEFAAATAAVASAGAGMASACEDVW